MKSTNTAQRESDRYLRQALNGLLGLKLRTGASIDDLHEIVDGCIQSASRDFSIGSVEQGLDIHRLGSVLRDWHKETDYLAADGTPLPLPLNGKTSVSKLISAHYPRERTSAVVRLLKRAGLIRRFGRATWIATSCHAQISTNSQEILDHVSEGVSRFLETVLNNINARNKSKLLFEQSCKVRSLPASKASDYRKFVRGQAIAFLTAVDDWLEVRAENPKSKNKAKSTCAAGVFTFAYLDSNTSVREEWREGRHKKALRIRLSKKS
jgi:hypothetical protein